MKVYINRGPSSEFYASDLYEDYGTWETGSVEAEISAEDWLAANKTTRDYWQLQDRFEELYKSGKYLRGDKE